MSGSEVFLLVVGWILVLEGITPFVNPAGWQRMLAQLAQEAPERIRSVAGTLVLLGLAIIWMILD